ncbi:hypothetical protein [Pontibacter rugosus]|uniref:Uncharacterized protein n=1 Tax=Pontibacter rugosus TaxID=1745966 RepID=A0ABW3SQN0_9BACT
MEKYFKIWLGKNDSSAGVWTPIMAESAGEAVVKADERCFGTPFTISGMTVTEISKAEYLGLLKEPALKYNFYSPGAASRHYISTMRHKKL